MKTAAVVSYKTIRRAVPADPTGHSVAALLTLLFEADPRDPLALNFWVGSVTRRADPAHSHPDQYVTVYVSPITLPLTNNSTIALTGSHIALT